MSIASGDFSEPTLPSVVLDDPRKLPVCGEGVKLRSEAVDISTKQAESWRYVTSQFGRYIKMKTGSRPVFENRRTGERFSPEPNHRFSRKYSHDRYGQILRGERDLLVRYDDPHTALITLTAPVRGPSGPNLPIDRHKALIGSYGFVRQKLNYELSRKRDLEFEYVAINGPTRNGNALGNDHIHIAVWMDGVVERDTLRPIVDKHLEKCGIATETEHRPERAIQVQSVNPSELKPFGADESFGGPATSISRYVGGHLPAIGAEQDVTDKPDQFVRHGALSWATGTRTFRTSSAFRAEQSESSGEWEHIGIETASGRFVGTDKTKSGKGIHWIETSEPDSVELATNTNESEPIV